MSRLGMGLTLALGLCACESTYSFELVHDDPHGAELEPNQVILYEGRAVGVVLREDGDRIDADADVVLVMHDAEVAGAVPINTLADDDYVLWGVAPGRTELDVVIDAEVEQVFEVIVRPQD